MSNTVKVENYNQGKSITLTVEEGQEYFLFCLFDSNKKIVGNPFESQIVSNVGSHEVIELASKLPDVTEPDTYKLYVSAKHKDKTIGEPVMLPWKEVGAKAITPPPSLSDPDTDKVKEIQTRLGDIERHLDMSIKRMENVKNPSKGYLLMVDGVIKKMRYGTEDISTIIASIETSKPTECAGFKDRMTQISVKMERLEDMCRGFKSVAAASAKAPVSNPDPAPATNATPAQATAPTTDPAATQAIDPLPTSVPPPATPPDLDPMNNRVDGLEKKMADLKLQLADKANSKDLTNLSGSVNGLDARVTSLKGQISGLETEVRKAGDTCNNRLDQIMTAVGVLGNQQVPAKTAATVQNAVPASANRISKNAFLAFVYGLTITAIIGIIFGIVFSAPRPQSTTPMIIGVPASQPNTTTPSEATVTPVTPPPAPAPLPKMSPEELEKMRTEIRAQQELALSAHPSLALRSYAARTKPSQEGSTVSINGNGNVVGKNVTINNNYQDPKTDSDKSGSYVPSTFQTSSEVGPRLVQTGHWSSTRMVNTVQIENPYGPGTGYVH
jgi:hypothetical protein